MTQISPKTWMRNVYYQRYLKLEKLARLGKGYSISNILENERQTKVILRSARRLYECLKIYFTKILTLMSKCFSYRYKGSIDDRFLLFMLSKNKIRYIMNCQIFGPSKFSRSALKIFIFLGC